MMFITAIMCTDCQNTLRVYARQGSEAGRFEIWQEQCPCAIERIREAQRQWKAEQREREK